MKTIVGIACLFAVIASTNGLVCLECENATSIAECNSIGTLKECGHPSDPSKVFSCQTHWRQRFDVPSLWIERVCKEDDACRNNADNNPIDCKGDKNQRVCRCCCYEDRCSQTINASSQCSGLKMERDSTTAPPPIVCDPPMAPENGDFVCPEELPLGYINGTECQYVCSEDFTLVGPNMTVCGPTKDPEIKKVISFDPPPPQCVPSECSTTANLVIAIDSSCSVGQINWDQIILFLLEFISHLEISPHQVNVAAFRYNIRVDKENAIYFGTEESTDPELFQFALENFPYDGEGTNTGLAIRFARQLFADVDRSNVKNVLLLITDGMADDEDRFIEQATALSLSNIIPFAIGVRTKEHFGPFELAAVTNYIPDQYFYLYSGVDELTPLLARILAARICVAEK